MRVTFSAVARCAAMVLAISAGVPAGAQPAPPPISAYAHPANMSSPSLSPDGEHVAYLTPWQGRQTIVIRKVKPGPGDKPSFVAPGDAEIKGITWANPERLVARVEEVEKIMGPSRSIPWRNRGYFAFNRDGTEMVRLKVDQIVDFVDEQTILGTRDGDVVRLDIYRNRWERVAGGTDRRIGFIPDPSGQVRVAVDYSDRTQTRTYLYRQKPGDSFDVLWKDEKNDGFFDILGFSADPDVVYVASNHEGDLIATYAFDLRSKTFGEKVASHPRYDVREAHVVKGRVVAFDWTDDLPARRWIDPAMQRLQDALDKAVPDSREIIVDQTKDGRFTLVASYSPLEPLSYKLFDRQTKEFSLFGDTFPKIPQAVLTPRKAVTYKARDGLEITGYLTLPPGREPRSLPFILMPHGGPISRDDLSFDLHAQFLASRGYAVFQPNFRGSYGYGTRFEVAGRGNGAARCRTT
ncbi:prolyl oligopeptidase family serine peptidase [Aerophototrophica crusticola]|uniref:Prolyl oligopeptidase family serine peptidase n=1 Tax=Aerophototrophica crusticola TaxID=1709002 RepID=A0A858RAR3_9PROT|nr:prolyl oligopeptidase family serine peptidase [Rhodospirillaceae bacterium B3]